MAETLVKVQEFLVTYGLKVIAAILIFIIGKWLAKVVSNFIQKIMLKSKVDQTLAASFLLVLGK